jgi:phosphoribosylformimino-5-aminoimidazole carboxamide ribotide isomerase
MLIIPAIDIRDGRCVRLIQGQPGNEIVYSEDPVGMALSLEAKGAKLLHVVDLDGAIEGFSQNVSIIREMVEKLSVPIELGGGIRHTTDIIMRLDRMKVHRIILGTLAAEKPEVMAWAAEEYPGRIVVGIDARDGVVAVKGWLDENMELTPLQLALEAKEAGVDTIVYTDISKDGMLEGPNVEATRKLIEETGMKVIASGGVSSMEDLQALEQAGAHGAIVGKAMYDGVLDIEEALAAFPQE